jgi:CheY-like chemotaxis protein/signal transduction histidine kinase
MAEAEPSPGADAAPCDMLRALRALDVALDDAPDLALLTAEVGRLLLAHLPIEALGIAVLETDGTPADALVFSCRDARLTEQLERTRAGAQVLARVLGAQGPRESSESATRPMEPWSSLGLQGSLELPLVARGRTLGALVALTVAPHRFGADEVEVLEGAARRLGLAVERARLEALARERGARLEALAELSRALGSTVEVEDVLRAVAEQMQGLVPCARLGLGLARGAPERLAFYGVERPAPGEVPVVRLHEPLTVTVGSPLARALYASGPVLLAPGELGVTHPACPEPEWFAAALPLAARDRTLGLLLIAAEPLPGAPPRSPFHERDLPLLGDLSARVCTALGGARLVLELHDARDRLDEAREQALRAARLEGLGALAAAVAQDFHQALGAILGRGELLRAQLTLEAQRRSLELIESAAREGLGRVTELRQRFSVLPLAELGVVRLANLARSATSQLLPRLHEHAIRVVLELDEGATVRGDPTELLALLINLVHHAVDAMPEGGHLTLRTGVDAEEGRAWLEVEDTRGLLADAALEAPASTEEPRAVGLGLSISATILQRHGGDLSVGVRQRGRRSVRARLPIARPGPAPSEAPRPLGPPPIPEPAASGLPARSEPTTPPFADPAPRPEPPRAGRRPTRTDEQSQDGPAAGVRVLVIDDDVAIREVLADILRSGDHRVVTAASGEEGLALFDPGTIDVVLTDLGLPGVSGWEVAERIKARSPRTPVGLITGWGASLGDEERSARGVDLVIAKPFRFEQVLEAVRAAASRASDGER